MHDYTTLGEITVSGFNCGNFYFPWCVLGKDEYFVPCNGTRLHIHGWYGNYQQWYVKNHMDILDDGLNRSKNQEYRSTQLHESGTAIQLVI